MLEIILAMYLVKSVKKNATDRGRKPGGFIALAISLWVSFEIIGFLIGTYMGLGYGTFVLAYGLVGISALISYNVAKHCKEGDYIPPNELTVRQFTEYYEPLPSIQNITITREKAFSGAAARFDMSLNGKYIGTVANGDVLQTSTDQRQNVLVAKVGDNEVAPFVFQVADGVPADIHFGAGRFIPERSTGLIAYGQAVVLDRSRAVQRYVPVVETKPMIPVYAAPAAPAVPVYTAPSAVQVATPVAAPVSAPAGAPSSDPFAAPVAAPASVAAPAYVPGEARFCESCGSPLVPGASFCGNCGARVK